MPHLGRELQRGQHLVTMHLETVHEDGALRAAQHIHPHHGALHIRFQPFCVLPCFLGHFDVAPQLIRRIVKAVTLDELFSRKRGSLGCSLFLFLG